MQAGRATMHQAIAWSQGDMPAAKRKRRSGKSHEQLKLDPGRGPHAASLGDAPPSGWIDAPGQPRARELGQATVDACSDWALK
eukprot:4219868-Pyramimonas_sp.AAC.1